MCAVPRRIRDLDAPAAAVPEADIDIYRRSRCPALRAEHPRHRRCARMDCGGALHVDLGCAWFGREWSAREEEIAVRRTWTYGTLASCFHGPTAARVDRWAEARASASGVRVEMGKCGTVARRAGCTDDSAADVGGVLTRAWGCSLNPLPGVWCLFHAGRRSGRYGRNGIGVAAVGLGEYAGRRARGGPTRREMAKCCTCP
jgi:hypothetical protein